jgi:hypothetical protein
MDVLYAAYSLLRYLDIDIQQQVTNSQSLVEGSDQKMICTLRHTVDMSWLSLGLLSISQYPFISRLASNNSE